MANEANDTKVKETEIKLYLEMSGEDVASFLENVGDALMPGTKYCLTLMVEKVVQRPY